MNWNDDDSDDDEIAELRSAALGIDGDFREARNARAALLAAADAMASDREARLRRGRPASAPVAPEDAESVAEQRAWAVDAARNTRRRDEADLETRSAARAAERWRAIDQSNRQMLAAARISKVAPSQRSPETAPAARPPPSERTWGGVAPHCTLAAEPRGRAAALPIAAAHRARNAPEAPVHHPFRAPGQDRRGLAAAVIPPQSPPPRAATSAVTPPPSLADDPLFEDLFRAQPAAPATSDSQMPAYSGADLLAYRRHRGITQSLLAHEMGVEQGTISKAEGAPKAVLGPALRRGMWNVRRNEG